MFNAVMMLVLSPTCCQKRALSKGPGEITPGQVTHGPKDLTLILLEGLQVLNEKLFVLDLFDFGIILTKAEVGVHLTVSLHAMI